jgi:hypothetical protein
MELLPDKLVDYRGAQLKEFDLDVALARRPRLLLIDELAHTKRARPSTLQALAGRRRRRIVKCRLNMTRYIFDRRCDRCEGT